MLSDLVSGISAANNAIKVVKELRELDRGIDEAAYKLKLAELTEALADAKLALTDAKILVKELEEKVAIAEAGPGCPVCRIGRITVVGVKKWDGKTWETHTCNCDNENCTYETTRVFNTDLLQYRA